MISAKVIKDSVSESGVRLTTFQLMYPRFIHAELMTHRVFSRNASSSRAIPVAKMLEMVRHEPAMPIHWGKNQPGMQAHEQLTGAELDGAKRLWLGAAEQAASIANQMNELGLHKQVANRILEPFQHIHVVVTATEWDNFYELRAHPDAQPEFHELALQMMAAQDASEPELLSEHEWHLPYVTELEEMHNTDEILRKASAARCARVSYLKHDGGQPSIEEDLALYERLVGGVPIHASPVEHQATPDNLAKEAKFGGFDGWEQPQLHGNFVGWIQFRKIIEQSFK